MVELACAVEKKWLTEGSVRLRRSLSFAIGVILPALLIVVAAQSFAEPKRGGTLTVIAISPIPSLNNAIRSGTTTGFPATKIFASPLRLGVDYKFQPYLAESWQFSADHKSLTLKLRQATFHDGTPITSKDVAFSIMTVKKYHPFKTMFEPVERVDTPDKKTAVIRLSKPHPALLMALTPPFCPILPEHIYGQGDIRENPANLKPVGSGPFKVVSFKQDEYLVLERYENFFIPGRPYLDKLVFRVISDQATRALVMEKGEADLLAEIRDVPDILRMQKSPNLLTTREGYSLIGAVGWLEFNTKKKPFDNKQVRQAISYAIDRKLICQSLFRGLAQVATGPIAQGNPYYSADVNPYNVDLQKANKMLDDAGYRRGANGIRFKMVVDAEVHPDIVQQYLVSQLKKVGIDVEARVSPDFATWANRTSNGTQDATINLVYNYGDPVIGVHRSYVSSNIKAGIPYSNTAQYSNPEIDALLERAANETDQQKRKALYAEFQKKVVDDCPMAFIYIVPYHLIYNKRVGNPVTDAWGFFQPGDELYVKQ
jgi:peptide/nickel transport system substrate-binding protein